jgi:hypothetical protein
MKLRPILAALAMVPAALNVAPAAAHGLVVPLCDGAGGSASVTLPAPSGEIPGKDQPGCCAKGCHTGQRKKALARTIDAGQ